MTNAAEWYPIETAPKDGTDVLAWWPGLSLAVPCRWTGHGYYSGPGWFQMSYSSASLRCEPTHWQPMPTLPATAKPVIMCTCGKVLETPRDYAAHCKEFPDHFRLIEQRMEYRRRDV